PMLAFAIFTAAACAPSPLAPVPSGHVARAPTPRQSPEAATNAEPTSQYDKPPPNVLEVLHAPSPPVPYVSPAGDTILLVSWVDYPPMSRVAEPFLRLAGARVEPKTRRRRDTPGGSGIMPCARDFTLTRVATGAEVHVTLPAGGCAEGPSWSADGKR